MVYCYMLFPILPPVPQIADQVGELLIHCRYGTKPIEDDADEYEVDPDGEWVT